MGRKGGSNLAWVVVAILAVIILFGGGLGSSINLGNFQLPDFFGGTGDGLVSVDKQLKLSVTDKYAGSARANIASGILVFDDTLAKLETLSTGADGTVNTAFTYPSGKRLYIQWDDSNNDMWFDITVPKMNSKDAEAATYNNIPLKVYQIGTYTTDDLKYAGTAINDNGSYNFTASGNVMTFSLTLSNTGADGTGLMESYDPVWKMNWQVWATVTFTGTHYEKVLTYGFDSDFVLGTTHYVAKHADANKLTKWKIGNTYQPGYEGVWSTQFTLDGTGYAAVGVGGADITMQITVYAKADPYYAQSHGGSFGPSTVELNEITVTLQR